MSRTHRTLLSSLIVAIVFGGAAQVTIAAGNSDSDGADLFRRDNLVAWCIVPFDAKKRGPEERAAMLEKLGFKHFAYDFRAEHVPTFEAEIEACKRHGVALDAWWFPGSLNADARHILELCRKHDIHPQLWISGGGETPASPAEREARLVQEAERIRPIAEAAAAQGLKVGLYNHGGWFGEPETQLAIIEKLGLPNVGIVYNQHHGHAHVERFAEILKKTLPHLLCVNLNGMEPQGDQRGQKILQLGQGSLDLKLLKILHDSGYRGPVGILGHTQDDAEARLQDNLDGLAWLHSQLDGKPAGPKPSPRTPVPGAKVNESTKSAESSRGVGYIVAGREEYRTPPLTVEVQATLRSKSGYNILVASDTKASRRHWELFTMPRTGTLAVYLPGRKPDHVHCTVDVCDGKPHRLAMFYEADRVRLQVDGRHVAEEKISGGGEAKPGDLAIGRLVEGSLGCDGEISSVRLFADTPAADASASPDLPGKLVGHWTFDAAGAAEVTDLSPRKNPAKRAAPVDARSARAPEPPPGVHLKGVDPRLKVRLVDRSPDQVYMGVKVDRDGHVFVGGREGVFVFESTGAETFAPRKEILRFPQDSIIMGLEFQGDDLYVLTSNALYRVPGGRVEHANLKPERMLWGLPLDLHVSFHCLAWGAEPNKLFITHGDPWLGLGDWNRPDHWGHWVLYSRGKGEGGGGKEAYQPRSASEGTTRQASRISKTDPSWRETPYCGQGAVLRFDVETGQVEVYATGLRGPVGLAFDDEGNLFTNDNDHEGRADLYAPARLLHVAFAGADFHWPRGWTRSRTPDRLDVGEPVCDLGRGVPCDLAFYEAEYLPEAFRRRLLMCRWDRHSVTGYLTRPAPEGNEIATRLAEETTLLTGDENCRPVGIAVAPNGSLLVTALFMTGNMAAPYCASDLLLVTRADQPPAQTSGDFHYPRKPPVNDLLVPLKSTDDPAPESVYSKIKWPTPEELLAREDERSRRHGVVKLGWLLTYPPNDYVPSAELSLQYPNESAFFKRKQKFWGSDEAVDLADLARIGSFTFAQRWKTLPHSADEEKWFALLVKALDDKSDAVRLQAAYYLSLLNDPRSELLVEKTRRDVLLKRLTAGKSTEVREAWRLGPWPDGDDATLSKPHPPEQGTLDLSASYEAGGKTILWALRDARFVGHERVTAGDHVSYYYTFRVSSGARQHGLAEFLFDGPAKLWVNGTDCGERVTIRKGMRYGEGDERKEVPDITGWVVDLQPGGNEFLLRVPDDADRSAELFSHGRSKLSLRAVGAIETSLPEKLESGALAARLREAAAAGGVQPIAAEFLDKDWTKEHLSGDPNAGRKLFGTLGCAKCHAIVPDQKSAGAPSLFESRRRFAVPHLVESLLLPSRQVAEPFRAQQITTDDGLTTTGLVVGETSEAVELLLPDATRKTLAKRTIEERMTTMLSPMPQGLVKTPDELRHLLAYLLSERPLPP